MKKWCGLFLIIILMLGFRVNAQANIKISVNDNVIKSPDFFAKNGTTYVAIRDFSNILECDNISWNSSNNSIVIKNGKNFLCVFPNSKEAMKNYKKITLSQKIEVKNKKTYIPIRTICEFFSCSVSWNNSKKTVEISNPEINVNEKYFLNLSEEDNVMWLAKIISAEARGEPIEGQIAVGNVVINRVNSNIFPDTIYDVIFDDNYGIQFTPVMNGTIYDEPTKESIESAKRVLAGENVIGDCLYFCNTDISESLWIPNNREFYKQIGKHSFYK